MSQPNDPRDSTFGRTDRADSRFAQDDLDSRFAQGGDADANGADDSIAQGDDHLHRVVDVEANSPQDAPAEATKPAKKRISFGVVMGGAVLLSILLWVIYTVMFANQGGAQQQMAQPQSLPMDVAPLGGAAAAPAASAGIGMPLAPAVSTVAPVMADPASGIASAAVAGSLPMAAQPGVSASAVLAASDSAAARQEMEQLRKDIEHLRLEKGEREALLAEQNKLLETLKSQAATCAANAARSTTRQQPAAAVKSSVAPARTQASVAVGGKPTRTQAPSTTVAKAASTSGEMAADGATLYLKAVVPSSGPNQRAWIMDGDNLVTVAKGETFRGAVVKEISASRVVTSKGTIFPAQ